VAAQICACGIENAEDRIEFIAHKRSGYLVQRGGSGCNGACR